MESEQRAEFGMGAVSLGYDPGEWASDYGGYKCSDDQAFAEALALVTAAETQTAETYDDPRDYPDDLPF
jgi:hypothetical protein